MGTYSKLLQQKQPTPPQIEERAKPKPKTKRVKAFKHESKNASKQAIMLSRNHDSMIELIRKAVKVVGKEPFFGRFTPEEKRALADIVYTYKRAGVRTSENGVARIAVNFLVQDYQERGEQSILERVLKSLNA